MKPTHRPAAPALEPVVPTPVRLVTSDADRTQMMHVGDLWARRSVSPPTAAPPSVAPPSAAPPTAAPPTAAPPSVAPRTAAPPKVAPAQPSLLAKLQRDLAEASLPKKAILVMLPLCGAMLALRAHHSAPALPLTPQAVAPHTTAATTPAAPAALDEAASPQAELVTPPTATPRSAADRLATGDFPTALAQYRELARQSPDDASYREAVRILERRVAAR